MAESLTLRTRKEKTYQKICQLHRLTEVYKDKKADVQALDLQVPCDKGSVMVVWFNLLIMPIILPVFIPYGT